VRALEYFVATSIDGFIAMEDGDFNPLLVEGDSLQALVENYPETFPAQARTALGINAPNRRFDTVVMGAGTYRVPGGLPSPYPHLRQHVVSRSLTGTPADVTVIREDPLEEIRRLKEEDGLAIRLRGQRAGRRPPARDRSAVPQGEPGRARRGPAAVRYRGGRRPVRADGRAEVHQRRALRGVREGRAGVAAAQPLRIFRSRYHER
jgi:dihydrofolate reductase